MLYINLYLKEKINNLLPAYQNPLIKFSLKSIVNIYTLILDYNQLHLRVIKAH